MFTTVSEMFSLLTGSEEVTAKKSHVQTAFVMAGIAFYILGVYVGQANPEGSLIGL